MPKSKQRSTREKGQFLARMRLEQKGYQVLPSDERGISFYVFTGQGLEPVKVKTIRYGSWQFAADKLMDITVSKDGVQTIHGRKPQGDEDMPASWCGWTSRSSMCCGLGQLYDVIYSVRDLAGRPRGAQATGAGLDALCRQPRRADRVPGQLAAIQAGRHGKYRGSKEYHLVYSELIRAAQYGGVTTYQAVAQIMNLPLRGSHMGSETGRVLGEISEDELNQGRPMLSAIAVGVSGLPGQGFFAWAEEMGRLSPGATEEEQLRFWEEEKKAVYRAWKREFRIDK